MPKSNIAVVTTIFPSPAYYWKGVFVANFCEALNRQGANVTNVICPANLVRRPVEFIRDWRAARSEVRSPFTVRRPVWLPLHRAAGGHEFVSGFHLRGFKYAVERELDALEEAPDVVYAHFILSALGAHEWCRRRGVKLVVVSGESSYEGAGGGGIQPRDVARAAPEFDHLFFASERNRQAFSHFLGVSEIYGSVLGNAVDLDRFKPMSQVVARERLGLPQAGRIVLFAGSFTRRKGVMVLSEAIGGMESVAGVFLGSGPLKPEGKHVLRAGPVRNEELPLWLNAADCFALPSLHEGRANALLEALACGLPCVVSDLPFNREFLKRGQVEFIDPESVANIREGISRVLFDSEHASRLRREGLEVGRSYSLDRRAQILLHAVGGSANDQEVCQL